MLSVKARFQLVIAGDSESGAVSTLLLILFSSGFVLALLSLVIDSSSLYLQRRLAQTTADQVAVAYAKLCSNAASVSDCDVNGATRSKIDLILSSTNAQVPAELPLVCGSSAAMAIRQALQACNGLVGVNGDCVSPDLVAHPQNSNWVRAYVKVITPATTTAVHPLIASFSGGPQQVDVWACSQYAWGSAEKVAITASMLPLAFAPCDLKVASSSVVALLNDSSVASCSVSDLNGSLVTSKLHGMLRFEAGALTGPCATGSFLAVGQLVCLSAKTLSQTGIYYPNTLANALASAYSTQTKVLLPVVNAKSASTVTDSAKATTFTTATVTSFIELKLKGYKSGATATGVAPTTGWPTACAITGNLCVNGVLSQRLSTNSGISPMASPNFGITALSPVE
ncbi:MAG: hypothetical protein RL556_383 [Actinomycetota bacterium]